MKTLATASLHLSLLGLFSCLLPAQGYVSPAHFQTAEGTGSQTFPFGVTTVPFRYIQVHDDVPAMAVRGMAFRHNSGATVFPVHAVTLDAWVSTAVTTSTTLVGTFDLNHGLDKRQVITNRQVNLPASDPADLPGQWVLDYAFDVPFAFAGSASLCWEVQITAKTQAANITYDACLGPSTNPAFQSSRAFTGCISTGRTAPMALASLGSMNWPAGTGTLNGSATQLLANGPVLYVLGFSRLSWNGIPLPIDVPGSTGAPSGTCTIYNDVWLIRTAVASATGSATSPLVFTPTPDMNGITVYQQVWGLDAAANPFGITTSNLLAQNLVAPYAVMPISRVSLSGSLGASGGVNMNVNVLPTYFY
jgi:hypothetical protein